MKEGAKAVAKSPWETFWTVAEGRVRVDPLMLPPTMMVAPTSEMAAPNPAITAGMRARAAFRERGHAGVEDAKDHRTPRWRPEGEEGGHAEADHQSDAGGGAGDGEGEEGDLV